MKKVYHLEGLDCANCAAKLENELNKLKSINKASINFMKQTLTLEYSNMSEEKILSKVKQVIQKIEPEVEIVDQKEEQDLKKDIIFFTISLTIFIVAIILYLTLPSTLKVIAIILFIISYLIIGKEVIIQAIQHLIRGKVLDENFLMSIATIGAFFIGEYPEAVAVMLFYQLGEIFQNYAVNHSRTSITDLMNIKPDYANVLNKGELIKKQPENVQIGDIIIVKPGEKIPLDGEVMEGESFINTVALTGESIPKKVRTGDSILNGCINQEGVLKIKVTSLYTESTVSKILELVENASSRKAESEKFITKFAKYYTPIIVVSAILLAIIPPLFFKADFSAWLYRALSFLVISCPCALVISIPLGFFGGIGACAKKGILVKGSNYLEDLSKVDQIIFDKTGTITEGVFEVQKIHTVNMEKKHLLETVALAEYYSTHPIAISIKNAYSKELTKNRIKEVKELSGLGIQATIDDKEVLVGNQSFLKQNNIKMQPTKEIGTIVYVAINKEYVGYILIADKIKDTSKKAVQELKRLNIHNLVMLTGDKKEIGESIAQKLELDSVYTELLPDQKVSQMESLLKNKSPNSKIAFVGDGINDAPVLALADIGIAMGGVGSDAAIEASDVVIMNDNLLKIVDAIHLSKRTLKIVKQDIYFSIAVKVLVLIFSAIGLSTMWLAIFADVGVSILAILNSLRLLRVK